MQRLGFFARRRLMKRLIAAMPEARAEVSTQRWWASTDALEEDRDLSWIEPRPAFIWRIDPALADDAIDLRRDASGTVVVGLSPVGFVTVAAQFQPRQLVWLGRPVRDAAKPDGAALPIDVLMPRDLWSGDRALIWLDAAGPWAVDWWQRASWVQPREAVPAAIASAGSASPGSGLSGGGVRHAEVAPGRAFVSDAALDAAAPLAPTTARCETDFCERFKEYHEKGWPILYAPFTHDGEEAFAVATLFALLRKTSALLVLAPIGEARHEPVYRDLIKYRLPIIRHNRLFTSFVPRKNRIYYVEDDNTAEAALACADAVLLSPTLVASGEVADRPEGRERLARILSLTQGRATLLAGGARVTGEGSGAPDAFKALRAAQACGVVPTNSDPEALAEAFLERFAVQKAARDAGSAVVPAGGEALRARRDTLRREITARLGAGPA